MAVSFNFREENPDCDIAKAQVSTRGGKGDGKARDGAIGKLSEAKARGGGVDRRG
jgi:hypothetical protein